MHIVVRADFNEIQMATLAVNLWKLTKKNKTIDSSNEVKYFNNEFILNFLTVHIFCLTGKNDGLH